ncbi:MAG: phosphoribosylamine--glycine ligase [Gemmatimonadales bacterium]
MRILVVGGGGREHALCWALRREDAGAMIWCAPGNPGTATVAQNLPISADDLEGLRDAAREQRADLVVVGPEAPLAAGLADLLAADGRPVFGPSAAAARLEASKAFAKDVMRKAGVPTAASRTFTDSQDALAYVARHPEPLVVKASGLAAGKGAIVCATRAEADAAVRAMMVERRFGEAGGTVVIEEFLQGEELSVLAITDGEQVVLLPPSQDHKRLGEGDTGPNTGGMGAYAPVSIATPALLARVIPEVILPTLQVLADSGARFRGVLYAGLMVDELGNPRVVEFNCRFGDPEAQVVLPLVEDGLTESLHAVAEGRAPTPLSLSRESAVTTVLAAHGYPDAPHKGAAITLPRNLPTGVTIFHAGTKNDPDGTLRVSGGRVLNVTAAAATFAEAQRRSREAAEQVVYEGKTWRRDIGWREAERMGPA